MMKLKHKKYKVIDYINIPIKVVPVTTIIMISLKALVATVPSFLVLGSSKFVDIAIDIFKNGQVSRIYEPLFMLMLLVGFSWISAILYSLVKIRFNLKMNEAINTAVVKKRSVIAYEHIENNDTWDLIARVGEEPSEHMIKGFDNLISIFEYIVKIASLMLIIVSQVWWVGIAILIIAIPLLMVSFKSGKLDYDAFSESEKYLRRADYLRDVISSREGVEERALFGYADAIDKRWFDQFEIARKIEYKAEKQNFIKMKIASGITALLSMIIALSLLAPVSKGQITVGMYMSLVTAGFNLVQQMSWDLSYVMQQYSKNREFLKDLSEFSALKEVNGVDLLPDISVLEVPFETLEFKNVHFSYPGTDKKILNGLSMKLEKDKQYAFVGENGAGKTTITKLLTGLYDNYEGEILVNGVDIKTLTQEKLKAYFSVVYQDFSKYYISLKDNVLLGCCGQTSDKFLGDEIVKKALCSMEMSEDIAMLPKGIDTHLGKILEDGVDLSGGQWQRVAIARTLVSKSPINILDEPTAALDPISESKVYSLFKKVIQKKTTILITHRLGAARIADEILLVHDGVIEERGTHEELLNKDGKYAEMFEAQRSWYNE